MSRSRLLNVLSLMCLCGLILLSVLIGVADFSLTDLFNGSDDIELFWVSRLPRTLAIVLSGASLSIAGVIIQVVLRNRFVSPSMMLFMKLINKLPPTDYLMIPLVGIVFGGVIESITVFIVYQTEMMQMMSVW